MLERYFSDPLLFAFALGFLGSGHCLAMCGGFSILSVSGSSTTGTGRAVRFLAYVLGKTCTYAVLGAAIGLGAFVLGGIIPAFFSVISVIAGLLMVMAGLEIAGLYSLAGMPGSQSVYGLLSRISARLKSTVADSRARSRLVLGALNGLLPCGLVYAALTHAAAHAAAQEGVLQSMAYMAVFGVGTIPALALTAITWSTLSQRTRWLVGRTAGWLLVVLGVVTLLRVFLAAPHG